MTRARIRRHPRHGTRSPSVGDRRRERVGAISQLDIGAIDTVFVGLHASLASVCFAGLIFLLRGAPGAEEISAAAQASRQRALLSMATALVLFVTASAQYALATGWQNEPVLAWIITAATAAASICGAALLYFTVVILFRAHDLSYATRLGRSLFSLAWITLGGYLWIDLSAATATIAFGGVPILGMPSWFVILSVIAVAGPMAGSAALPAGSSLRRLACRVDAYERMLRLVVIVALGSPVVAIFAFAFEITEVVPVLWAGLALLAMVAISVALSAIRLVLVELLDPSDPARATVVDPAAA